MLYLILHKVRGEPAYDIAINLVVPGGTNNPWWIIPTSGHRAYPYRWWCLEDLADISDINMDGHHDRPASFDHTVPEDWPDHYQTKAELLRHPAPNLNQDLLI
jgi:hypothetical protein